MAERNSSDQAIILTVKDQGESNRNICILSETKGIYYATLYGGAKSKMRALVQPFNSGIIYIYSDETKHAKKITDFDVKNSHPTLRTNLYKMWAANLAAEIVLKTKAAGQDKNAFILLKAFLDGIDAVDENSARTGTIRFLWRYIGLLGLQPELHECSSCGRSLFSASNEKSISASYSAINNGFVCRECTPYMAENKITNLNYSLNLSALTYIASINELSPKEVRSIKIDTESISQLNSLLFALMENAIGSKLKTLEMGIF